MPKAYDPKHNYYADLDLPTSASIDDVRKQYRKLALQYHPDRNSGREEECVPKFQAIQAANEILSDPNQKLLYDGDRGRAGGASGVRGHPYQATSNFAPPPRRTQPGVWQRPAPTAQRPQPNGADRFSNFAQPPPPRRPDPTQERSNMFKAWNNMNNAAPKPAPPPRSTVPPSPGGPPQRRPQAPPRADTHFPSEEKVRAGYQYRDATSPQYDSEGADSRRSAWEAFKNGQAKSPGVRRSNTAKTPKKDGFNPNAPGSDERPAAGSYYSHRHRSEDFGQPADREPKKTQPRRPNIDPTDPHTLRTRFADEGEDDVPYSEGERKRTPYSSFIGEKTDFSSNMRKSKSTIDSTKLRNDDFRTRSTSPQSKSAHTTPINPRKGATFDFTATDSEPESAGAAAGDADSSSSYEPPLSKKPPKLSKEPKDRPKIIPSPPSRRYNGAQGPFSPPLPNDPAAGEKKDNIFNLANGVPTFIPPSMPTGKSRSEENINTKFSGDWNGEFSGAPTNVKPKQPTRKATNKSRVGNRSTATFGQPSPLGVNAFQDLPGPPPGPPPNHAATPTDTPTGDFSKDHWEQASKDGWFPPPPPRPPTMDDKSPTAQTENEADTPDRMDVDEEVPSVYNQMPPPPKPPRMMHVPQQHQANTSHVRSASNTTSGPSQAGLKTNLDDLSHVEPLARSADAGLKNMADMATNLPFKSQAAHILSFQQDIPQKLAVPSVPIPPPVPDKLTKASWDHYVAEFKRYLQFFDYFDDQVLGHFRARQQLSRQLMAKGLSWVEAVGDVASSESPNVPTGFMAYARGTEEDATVREIWNVGHDRHLAAVRAFGDVRNKVRAMTEAGGLPER